MMFLSLDHIPSGHDAWLNNNSLPWCFIWVPLRLRVLYFILFNCFPEVKLRIEDGKTRERKNRRNGVLIVQGGRSGGEELPNLYMYHHNNISHQVETPVNQNVTFKNVYYITHLTDQGPLHIHLYTPSSTLSPA